MRIQSPSCSARRPVRFGDGARQPGICAFRRHLVGVVAVRAADLAGGFRRSRDPASVCSSGARRWHHIVVQLCRLVHRHGWVFDGPRWRRLSRAWCRRAARLRGDFAVRAAARPVVTRCGSLRRGDPSAASIARRRERRRAIPAWTEPRPCLEPMRRPDARDRKSTRLNSSHVRSSYAVFCLKKKKKTKHRILLDKKKKKKKKTKK